MKWHIVVTRGHNAHLIMWSHHPHHKRQFSWMKSGTHMLMSSMGTAIHGCFDRARDDLSNSTKAVRFHRYLRLLRQFFNGDLEANNLWILSWYCDFVWLQFSSVHASLAKSVEDIFKKCRKHVLMALSVCSESGGGICNLGWASGAHVCVHKSQCLVFAMTSWTDVLAVLANECCACIPHRRTHLCHSINGAFFDVHSVLPR